MWCGKFQRHDSPEHRRWRAKVGRAYLCYERRTPRARSAMGFVMGRFGGGWNWSVGVRWGGRSVHLDLLVFMVMLEWLTDERSAQVLKYFDKEHGT